MVLEHIALDHSCANVIFSFYWKDVDCFFVNIVNYVNYVNGELVALDCNPVVLLCFLRGPIIALRLSSQLDKHFA